MLIGRQLTLLLPKLSRGAPTARLGSMFGYGLAYAIASLSCTIGPFLVVTTTTFRDGSILDGVLAYLAYGLGMTLVVGVLATAVALASSTVTTAAGRLLPHINRIGGVLLVLVGLYVGYYGVCELRLYFGDGNASDPVIEAAGGIQQLLANWVDNIGVLPLLGVLAVLVSGAVVLSGGAGYASTEQPPAGRPATPASADRTASANGTTMGSSTVAGHVLRWVHIHQPGSDQHAGRERGCRVPLMGYG